MDKNIFHGTYEILWKTKKWKINICFKFIKIILIKTIIIKIKY